MNNTTLPADFEYVPDMYQDSYFPKFLVEKVKDAIKEVVSFIEKGSHTPDEIQEAFDRMTYKINDLQDEFDENDSDIETGARESIGETVDRIIFHFELNIDTEDAIRVREW